MCIFLWGSFIYSTYARMGGGGEGVDRKAYASVQGGGGVLSSTYAKSIFILLIQTSFKTIEFSSLIYLPPFLSNDDKARVPPGLAAASLQAPILVHLEYSETARSYFRCCTSPHTDTIRLWCLRSETKRRSIGIRRYF